MVSATVGRPRVHPDSPKRAALRDAQRRYYETHREERLLKGAMYKCREDVREKIRKRYHETRDAVAQATGVPRQAPGKPRATLEERLGSLAAQAERAGLVEVANSIRAQLKERSGDEKNASETERTIQENDKT